MELDAQVEDTLQASAATANPEQKHKHKKKDKHKHKHHKRSKRERHGDVIHEQSIDEAGRSLAEGEVARTGSEDGELPGPPAVEGPVLSSVSVTDEYQEAADRNSAGLEQNRQSQQTVLSAKRRADHDLQAEVGKRSRKDQAGVTGQSAHLDSALVSQPYLNGDTRPSTILPVPDSATEQQASGNHEHRHSAEQPSISTAADQPGGGAPQEPTASHHLSHHTDAADKPSRHDKADGSHRDRRSDSKHGRDSSRHRSSSSRRPQETSHHRSSSQRPTGSIPTGHRDSSRPESRPDSRGHQRGTERQIGYSDRQHQRDSKPDARSDPRGSSDVRQRPDSSMRGHSRDNSRGYREQDRHRDYHGDGRNRHDACRGADRRHDGHRESDSARDKRKREEKQDKEAEQEFVAKVEAALQANEVDEDQLIEERRKRRQQILAKHQQEQAALPGATTQSSARSTSPAASRPLSSSPQPSSLPPSSVNGHAAPVSPLPRADSAHGPHVDVLGELPAGEPPKGGIESPSISDDEQYQKLDGDLWQQGQGEGQLGAGVRPAGTLVAPSAEPEVQQAGTDDRKVPREAAEEAKEAVVAPAAAPAATTGDGLDMFADNVDADMFAEDPAVPVGAAPAKKALLDNYDDVEGYYNFQVGEVMDGRYEVFATHGKGVFSTVLRARDQSEGAVGEVAIKIIRANETMYKAAQTEKIVLRKLSGADPEGRRHCIKLLRTFDYRGHLCMAFEAMDINLRELTKKYGRGIGLNIAAVSKYSAQMLISLYHLRNCGVVHADIKPDNILVSASRTMVKLADFGSAMFSGDNEITPYLVSRFYRPPEVILGLKYDHALDIWSVGCVIYELFTGKILFPGKTNNEMLKLIMDVKGPFPKKMLKKGAFTDRHFEDDPNMSFAMLEEDAVTKRPIRRTIAAPHIRKDFAGLLAGAEGNRKKVAQLADLLERMMALDPDKRITPKDALKHPFIKEPKA